MPASKGSCGHRRWKEWQKACPSVSPAPLCTRWGGNRIPTCHTPQVRLQWTYSYTSLPAAQVCAMLLPSAFSTALWAATSWRTPEWFLCAHGKNISFFRVCSLHKRSTQSVCRYAMQNSAVVWWAQLHARSQEEEDRLGVEEEED